MLPTSYQCLTGMVEYPTADGRTLRFAQPQSIEEDNGPVEYHYTLSVHERSDDDVLPTDLLEFRMWVPDAEGRVWTVATRFTAHRLVTAMFASQWREPIPESGAPPTALVLEGVRASMDDRVYVSLAVGEETYLVRIKYTSATLDLGADDGSLAVRVRASSLWTADAEPVPPFSFRLSPERCSAGTPSPTTRWTSTGRTRACPALSSSSPRTNAPSASRS